jgi:hypothetical protein
VRVSPAAQGVAEPAVMGIALPYDGAVAMMEGSFWLDPLITLTACSGRYAAPILRLIVTLTVLDFVRSFEKKFRQIPASNAFLLTVLV